MSSFEEILCRIVKYAIELLSEFLLDELGCGGIDTEASGKSKITGTVIKVKKEVFAETKESEQRDESKSKPEDIATDKSKDVIVKEDRTPKKRKPETKPKQDKLVVVEVRKVLWATCLGKKITIYSDILKPNDKIGYAYKGEKFAVGEVINVGDYNYLSLYLKSFDRFSKDIGYTFFDKNWNLEEVTAE